MSIWDHFNKKPGHKKTRKRKTKAEKRKDWAEERLMARAQTDPRAESAMILAMTGVDIPPIDEAKQEERKQNEKITRMAFEEIESDEVLKKRATAMKIEHILGSDSRTGHGEEGEYFPFEGERSPLDIIKMYREIESEFGEGTGALAFLKDPGVWQQALALANRVLGKDVADGEGHMVSVEVDGQFVKMTPEVYELFRRQRKQLDAVQGQVRRLTAGQDGSTQTGTEEKPAETEPETQGPKAPQSIEVGVGEGETMVVTPIYSKAPGTEPEASPEPSSMSATELLEFAQFAAEISTALDGSPEDFAQRLVASAEEGNEDAQRFVTFLSQVNYDKIMELVEPYRETEGLVDYINKLSDSKEWVEEALAGIRRLVL